MGILDNFDAVDALFGPSEIGAAVADSKVLNASLADALGALGTGKCIACD